MVFNAAQLDRLTPEQVKDIAEGKILLMDVLGVTAGEMLYHLDTALNLIAVSKLEDAARILKGLAALDVRNPAFVSALGSIELLKKNFETAIDLAQNALRIDSKFVTAYYVLGEAYAQAKRNNEAIAAFEKAFELKPGDVSRDSKRCRTIYVGLTGKMAPSTPPPASMSRPAPVPATAAAPGAAPPKPAPGYAPQAPSVRPMVPRAAPVPAAMASRGGAPRPGPSMQMVSRAGAGGAPVPMRA